MPAKISKDNTSGEDIVDIVKGPNNLFDIGQEALVNVEARRTRESLLPGEPNPEISKEINWLGSSYSGADIKVVAHLYDAISEEEKVAKLEEDQQVAIQISDAASLITASSLEQVAAAPEESREQAFLAVAGLGNQTDLVLQRAAQFIINNIFRTSNFSTFLGRSSAARKATGINHLQQRLAESIQSRVERLKRVQAQGSSTITLATLQTISVQSHREKFGVRALGHSYVKGYTRGPRTIAGSMIFTVFDKHALADLIYAMGESKRYKDRDPDLSTYIPDQLPPLDLTIIFANEYGSLSRMSIYGVEFVNDGVSFSIEDMLTENVMQFVARDIDIMTRVGKIKLSRLQRGGDITEGQDISGSDLLFTSKDSYNDYMDRLGVRRFGGGR